LVFVVIKYTTTTRKNLLLFFNKLYKFHKPKRRFKFPYIFLAFRKLLLNLESHQSLIAKFNFIKNYK
jgi:hypothetical protein